MCDASAVHAETGDVPVSGGDGSDHAACDGGAVVEFGEDVELGCSVLFFDSIFDCGF
jgi:hypothetical protein